MASILYYGIEQKQAFDEQMRLLEMAELEVQTIDDDTKDLEVDEQPWSVGFLLVLLYPLFC